MVFGALCVWEVWRSPRAELRPAAGFGLLALALLWQYLCLSSDGIRFARPALALAVAGLSLFLGRASMRAALMAIFSVPVPSLILEFTSQRFGATVLTPALTLLRMLGRPAVLAEDLLQLPGASLEWIPADTGVALAVFGAGLACRELPHPVPIRRALRPVASAAALAFALAAAAANAAVVLLAATSWEAASRFVLRQLPWLAVLGAAVWRARTTARAARAEPT